MVGAGKCRRAARSWSILRSLLFPLLPGAVWWLQVSAHGRDSELDLVLPWLLTPSPFLPHGLSPHILTPSSGTTASARRGKGQVPKGGFVGGELVTCWQYGESGKLGLAPLLSRLSPCPPRPLLLQAWPLAAVSILRALAAVITAGVERWVESFMVPYTASSRVTSGACREGPARKPASPLACCLAGLNCPSHSSRIHGSRPYLPSCPSSALHRARTLVCHTLSC